MHEFESVSASSYDPSALATKLTAKSADGWKVVAIVPTGGDVTAFLSRETADGEADVAMGTKVEEVKAAEPEKAPEPAAEEKKPEPEPESAKPEPAAEPSGWAIAPEPASSTPETATSPSITPTIAPAVSTPSPQPAAAQPTAAQPAAAQPAAAQPAAAAQPGAVAPSRPEPAPTPTPSVPAGWYADPAGRFELRYWDGGTWTEHVSRAGQHFTDPPVA